MAGKPTPKRTISNSAITGRFVSKQYAATHPKTTETKVIRKKG